MGLTGRPLPGRPARHRLGPYAPIKSGNLRIAVVWWGRAHEAQVHHHAIAWLSKGVAVVDGGAHDCNGVAAGAVRGIGQGQEQATDRYHGIRWHSQGRIDLHRRSGVRGAFGQLQAEDHVETQRAISVIRCLSDSDQQGSVPARRTARSGGSSDPPPGPAPAAGCRTRLRHKLA